MKLVPIILLVLLFGCNSPNKKAAVLIVRDSVKISQHLSIKKDTITKRIAADTFKVPSKYFYNIAQFLDSIGASSDTVGIRYYAYYISAINPKRFFKEGRYSFFVTDTDKDIFFTMMRETPQHQKYHPAFYQHMKGGIGYFFSGLINKTRVKAFAMEWRFQDTIKSKLAEDELHCMAYDGMCPPSKTTQYNLGPIFFYSKHFIFSHNENVYTVVGGDYEVYLVINRIKARFGK